LFTTSGDVLIAEMQARIRSEATGIVGAKDQTPTVPMPFEKIYPISELLSPSVQHANKLLEDAHARLENAIRAKEEEDEFVSDDQLNHVVILLRELFCCRDIGDGFGAVVNAALAGLENLEGKPATVHQMTQLMRRLESIRVEPFITIAQAAELIEKLEAAGFETEPAGLRVIEDWLDE
jgi:hypothetical protein